MKIPALNDFNKTFGDPIWLGIAKVILHRHGVEFTVLRRAEHGENIVFFIDKRFILKIYTPLKNGFNREKIALVFTAGKTSLSVPAIVEEGEIEGFYYLIMTQFQGEMMTLKHWLSLDCREQIGLMTRLAAGLKELHSNDPSEIEFDWREFLKIQVASAVEKQVKEGGNPEWIERIPDYLEKNLHLIPQKSADAFQHGDVHFGNMRFTRKNGELQISGLFDFADSIVGFHEYEFVAIGVLMIQGQGDFQREFFRAYGYKDSEIDETLRRRMMLLTLLYEYSSLRRYAVRLRPEAVNYTFDELERAIWSFI